MCLRKDGINRTMKLIKELPELVKSETISQNTADKIQDYYKSKDQQSTSRLFIAFGILGAILVGLGIMLIIAHNWDELSKVTKTLLAFFPLLAGQFLCVFVLVKKNDSVAWKESVTTFSFFSVGACISLISQIYNISGSVSQFLLTWMLLCLPLVYVMKSSTASLLYLIGITYYACEICYWTYPRKESYIFWILLTAILPYYFLLSRNKNKSNFFYIHGWLIPISITIILGTLAQKVSEFMFIAYFSLFGLYSIIGSMDFFFRNKIGINGFKIIGSLGSIILLIILSFRWFWKKLIITNFQFNEVTTSPEFLVASIISILAGSFLFIQYKNKSFKEIDPINLVFILFIITFIIGFSSLISIALINLFVFTVGILTIRKGVQLNKLGILNYGLLIVSTIIACRFFDSNISFVLRGIFFISIGISFLVTNLWMLKKKKQNEK